MNNDIIRNDWEFYDAKLVPHKTKGRVRGYRLYIPRECVAKALGVDPSDIPEVLRAARIVLDPGTRQILIRLRKEE